MSTPRIALVTGAAKGIGFEVARQLIARGFEVTIGARNVVAGKAAAAQLGAHFLELDVASPGSVTASAAAFASEHAHLDVLVNNAAILDEHDDAIASLSPELLARTFDTNTAGPLRVTQAFLKLIQGAPAPRVINVSSGGGQLSSMSTWSPAYCISKTALNALTLQFANAFPSIAFNAVCPGWVRTDMGGAGAPRSVEQGAETIVWLADEAPQTLRGKFLRDRAEIPW